MDWNMYEQLKIRFGKYSSWLIFDEDNPYDYNIIEEKRNEIKPWYVFCALNAAEETSGYWEPFHVKYSQKRGGRSKTPLLSKLFNKSRFRGAYITDIIKGVKTRKEKECLIYLENNKNEEKEHVRNFIDEIDYLKKIGGRDPEIYILGWAAWKIYSEYSKDVLSKIHPLPIYHYSARDDVYIEALKILINSFNYEPHSKYAERRCIQTGVGIKYECWNQYFQNVKSNK